MTTNNENEPVALLTRTIVNYGKFITKWQRFRNLDHQLGRLSETFSCCEEAIMQARATGRELDDDDYRSVSREWEKCKKLFQNIQSDASYIVVDGHWIRWAERIIQLEMAGDDVDEALVREMLHEIPLRILIFKRKLIEFQIETSMVFDHLFDYSPQASIEEVVQ